MGAVRLEMLAILSSLLRRPRAVTRVGPFLCRLCSPAPPLAPMTAHRERPFLCGVRFRRTDVDVGVRQLGEPVQIHDRRRAGLLEETLVLGGETIERAAREAAFRRRDGDAAEPSLSSCRGLLGHWRTLLCSGASMNAPSPLQMPNGFCSFILRAC